jgi:hypothetical protein
MATQQQSTELTEVQQKLSDSIQKYKSTNSSVQSTGIFKKKLSVDIEEQMTELKTNLANTIQTEMLGNNIKEPFFRNPFQANEEKKEALLRKLPEPLRTIVREKKLDLEGLQKLLVVIENKNEQASKKAAKKEGDMVLKDDIQEIIDHYKALARIQKSEKLRQIRDEEKPTNAQLRDFLLSKHTTTLPAEVIDSLLILSNGNTEPNLDNIVKSFKQIENFEEIESSPSQSLKDAAKHYAENTLGVRSPYQYFKKGSIANETMVAFIKFLQDRQTLQMTEEERHLAWAQKFQEIVDKYDVTEREQLFKQLNASSFKKQYQDIKDRTDEDLSEPNGKPLIRPEQIPAFRRETQFFGDYLRISQRVLAQHTFRSMYSELEAQAIPQDPKSNYAEYKKDKLHTVPQLMMPDVVKQAVSASPLMVASSAPQSQFQNTDLQRLSELNLLKNAFDLSEDLRDDQKELIKTIPGGEKYLQDRELLKKVKESRVFEAPQLQVFDQLFHQNHEEFYEAYAREKKGLLDKVNAAQISGTDSALYQQIHREDCETLGRVTSQDEKFKAAWSIHEQQQALTQESANLKNTYNSVVILGNYKPVALSAGDSTQVANQNQVSGQLVNVTQHFFDAPLTRKGVELTDESRQITFEVKQLDKGTIHFGNSNAQQMSNADKDKLFASISENILANWTPGKNVVLNVADENDALPFYYCMQKMSEHFKQIHKDNKYAAFDKFSMDKVQVCINGRSITQKQLEILKQQVKDQESLLNPLKTKYERLTDIKDSIPKTQEHSYHFLAAARHAAEIEKYRQEVNSECYRIRAAGKEFKDKMQSNIFNRMKKEGVLPTVKDENSAGDALIREHLRGPQRGK